MSTAPLRRLGMLALLLVLALVAAACSSGDDAPTAGDDDDVPASEDAGTDDATDDAGGEDPATEEAAGDAPAEDVGTIVVGSTNFDEQEIVANMYALALEEAGIDVETRFQLGAREIVLPALEAGEIDTYPEYVGTALEFLNDGAGEATADTDESLELLRGYFADRGVEVLEPSEAEDKNALVVTQETADEHGLATVSDLVDVAGELVFGGPPECPERPLCLIGYEEVYGLQFAEFRALDAGGPITAEALSSGEIDVALLFSTDGVIAANDWVLLEDDQGLQPAENIVPVVRQQVATDAVVEALNAVSEVLTTEGVTELIRRVRLDAEDPATVAEDYLIEHGVIGG